MRNIWGILTAAAVLSAGIVCLRPEPGTGTGLPADKLAYQQRFNRWKEILLPAGAEEREGGEEGYDNPEMFARMDWLKRADPNTGLVPDNALFNAWMNLRAQFPESMAKTNYALNWDERGPNNVGGRSRALMFDPNDATHKAVFAGGVGGGLWRCTDVTNANPGWVQVSPIFANVALTCINYDPSNPQIMYYGTGEGWNNVDAIRGAGMWKSTDGGQTWDVLPSTVNNSMYYMQDIIVNSLGHVFLATKGGLWKSTNGGTTWTKVLGLTLGAGSDWITDMETNNSGDIYAAVRGSGIFVADAAAGAGQGDPNVWVRTNTNFSGNTGRIEIAAAWSDPNVLYAVTTDGDAVTGVWKTTNAGNTWSATTAQPDGGNDYSNGQAWYDLTIDVDPTNPNRVFTGGIDQWRSTNGGSSWTQVTFAYGGGGNYMHPDQHNMAFRPGNPTQVVFSNDGGIWYSSNNGSGVAERNTNYNVTQYYSLAINPQAGSNILIGGTQDNGSHMVNTPGIGPGLDLTGGDGAYSAINQQKPDTLFTTSQYSTVYRSRDNGNNFTYIGNSNLQETDVLFINPLEIDPNNGEYLYQASTSLWRHSNAGSGGLGGWVQATANLGSNITAIGISKSTPNLVYVATGGTVYRIANANTGNFTTNPPTVNPSGLPGGYINCVAVDPNDGNHIIVTYTSFGLTRHVMETRNAQNTSTATWTNLTGNLPDMPVNWAVYEPNNPNGVLIGTDLGVFRCADITAPYPYWSPERQGMGMPRVDMMKVRYSDNTVHASTHGRGFFSTNSYNLAPIANWGLEDASPCYGTVQFVDSTQNAPNSWLWDFGDGNSSTSANPQHVYTSSGTYTVTLTVGNPNGTDTYSQTVNITVLGGPTAVASGDTTACAGTQVPLLAAGGAFYSWSPSAGLSDPNIANPIYTVAGTRTFIVTVTDSNGCTDQDTVVVTQASQPNIWAGSDQTINSPLDSVQLNAQGGITYSWTPSTGLSCTSCPNPKASPPVTTTYTVTGTNAAGCARTDQVTVFVIITGNDPSQSRAIAFWGAEPNPVHGQASLRWYSPAALDMRISLLDMQGRSLGVLVNGQQPAGIQQRQWDASGLAAGTYFLRMESGGQSWVRKVVVQ